MKKNFIFSLYAIILAIFFVLTGAFAASSVVMPQSYWISVARGDDKGVQDAFVTLDLDRSFTEVGEDGKETTVQKGIGQVYAYIGRAYTLTESDGESFAEIYFDFKTISSKDDTYLVRKHKDNLVPYAWNEIFVASSGDEIKDCSRVKIHTPDTLEIMEVVFLTADGELIKVDKVYSESDFLKEGASGYKIVDEQDRFTSSREYRFTLSEEETAEMQAANALFHGGEYVGRGPLTTALNAVSIAVFGRNTFGIRFFSLLFGYISLLVIYLIIRRLFGSDIFSLIESLSAFVFGCLFGASVAASAAVSVFFVLLSYYLAIGFYAEFYKFEGGTVRNLVFTALAIGGAISCGASNILYLIGIPVIWALSLLKLNSEFKSEYENARGLKKEDVYIAFHKKTGVYAWAMPTVFILAPAAITILFYAVNASPLVSAYKAGFFSAAMLDIGNSFAIEYKFFPLIMLVGIGGEKLNGGYTFVNYVPCILALVSFIFTSLTAFLSKNDKFGKAWRSIKNKYTLLWVLFVSSLLPILLGINQSVYGFAVTSAIYSAYIPLAVLAVEKFTGKSFPHWLLAAIGGVCLLTFIGIYIGSFGFDVSSQWANVLYKWQI